MSHEAFTRSLLRDVACGALAASVLAGVSLVAPAWVVGVLCLLLVPALVLAVFAWAAFGGRDRSRRRDDLQAPLTAPDRAVSRGSSPVVEPGSRGPGAQRSREQVAGRNPFVVTAWVDAAWATHNLALHSYRVTRPGR
jgi:hypothetical protein